MKAPKKLYLRKRCKLPYDVVQNEWYEQPPISVYGSIVYIRADALVAEIERMYDEVPEVIPGVTDDREYGNIGGQEQFYEKVMLYINKIIKED